MNRHYLWVLMVNMRYSIVMLMVSMFIFSLFTVIVPVDNCKAEPTTIYVDDSGGADYTTIGEALTNANNGDTVYVYSGTYNENILINKTITLTGDGSSSTIIQGGGDHTIKVIENTVTISKLTSRNDGTSYYCIYLNSVTSCEIDDCIIQNGGIGISLVNSDSNTIKNTQIEDNNVGIKLTSSSSNSINNNEIQNNNADGVFLDFSSNTNSIYQNYFTNNNLYNARDLGSNSWSYSSKGNSWDDYNDYDSNGDGTGDNPYIIDGDSQDDYPQGVFLTLNEKPVASIESITPNPAAPGQNIQFFGGWTDDGSIIQWEWKSDLDGVFGYGKNSASSTLSTGTHSISFRIKDNGGIWSDYATPKILIIEDQGTQNEKPTASIESITQGSEYYGEAINFHGSGQDTDGYIQAYQWRSSRDGIISSVSTFTKSDLSIGEHTIYFKVQDNDGEWSSEKTSSLEVKATLPSKDNNQPIADSGGPYTGYTNTSLTFDASGSIDNDEGDSIISYEWEFGDGGSGSGQTHSHTYSTQGDYIVSLTVTDSHGSQGIETTYATISQQTNNNGENGKTGNGNQDENNNDDKGIPGFEFIFVILALLILVIKRKKEKS